MGAAWGLVNGWLAAYQGIPPFIVTLATMSVIRGIALYRTEGFSVPVPADTYFAKLGTAEFLGFSASAGLLSSSWSSEQLRSTACASGATSPVSVPTSNPYDGPVSTRVVCS